MYGEFRRLCFPNRRNGGAGVAGQNHKKLKPWLRFFYSGPEVQASRWHEAGQSCCVCSAGLCVCVCAGAGVSVSALCRDPGRLAPPTLF
jgi:hypothetical protein